MKLKLNEFEKANSSIDSVTDAISFPIATTNYIEKLSPRFYNRPSRFDIVEFVDLPSIEERKIYLSTIEKSYTEEELTYIINKTDGFSFAHLRDVNL